MTEQAYENALRRKREIQRELNEIDEFLRLHQKYQGIDGEQARPSKVPHDRIRRRISGVAGRADLKGQRSPSRDVAAKVAYEILLENGEPMTRTELVEAFDKRGNPIAGTDRAKNMGTIMWRLNDKFVNIEGYGYWPKDVPCEKVGYDPAEQRLFE